MEINTISMNINTQNIENSTQNEFIMLSNNGISNTNCQEVVADELSIYSDETTLDSVDISHGLNDMVVYMRLNDGFSETEDNELMGDFTKFIIENIELVEEGNMLDLLNPNEKELLFDSLINHYNCAQDENSISLVLGGVDALSTNLLNGNQEEISIYTRTFIESDAELQNILLNELNDQETNVLFMSILEHYENSQNTFSQQICETGLKTLINKMIIENSDSVNSFISIYSGLNNTNRELVLSQLNNDQKEIVLNELRDVYLNTEEAQSNEVLPEIFLEFSVSLIRTNSPLPMDSTDNAINNVLFFMNQHFTQTEETPLASSRTPHEYSAYDIFMEGNIWGCVEAAKVFEALLQPFASELNIQVDFVGSFDQQRALDMENALIKYEANEPLTPAETELIQTGGGHALIKITENDTNASYLVDSIAWDWDYTTFGLQSDEDLQQENMIFTLGWQVSTINPPREIQIEPNISQGGFNIIVSQNGNIISEETTSCQTIDDVNNYLLDTYGITDTLTYDNRTNITIDFIYTRLTKTEDNITSTALVFNDNDTYVSIILNPDSTITRNSFDSLENLNNYLLEQGYFRFNFDQLEEANVIINYETDSAGNDYFDIDNPKIIYTDQGNEPENWLVDEYQGIIDYLGLSIDASILIQELEIT